MLRLLLLGDPEHGVGIGSLEDRLVQLGNGGCTLIFCCLCIEHGEEHLAVTITLESIGTQHVSECWTRVGVQRLECTKGLLESVSF